MPTTPGVPLPFMPAGALNPVDWVDDGGMGAQASSLMRGTGGALAFWQRRQIPQTPTIAQGAPVYLHSRPYSRGAGAFAPKFGVLPISPIGAGVLTAYKLPVIAGPGARYEMGAIWFDVQSTPTSIHMSPTVPMSAINALLATNSVAAMYPTTG